MKNLKLELCSSSIKAIQLAKKYHFDRIELCQNLENGGTTPSFGMIQFAVDSGAETHVLIRPRIGDFIYSKEEIEIMLVDVKKCKSLKTKGLVVGSLTKKKEIDEDTITQMLQSVNDLEFTFHRAFDDVSDWKKAMDLLIKLNFKRILTSGCSKNVDVGFEMLQEMVKYADGRIEIMIGGGVNSKNIHKIVTEIKPDAIHFSGTSIFKQETNSIFSCDILDADEEKIKNILERLKIINSSN